MLVSSINNRIINPTQYKKNNKTKNKLSSYSNVPMSASINQFANINFKNRRDIETDKMFDDVYVKDLYSLEAKLESDVDINASSGSNGYRVLHVASRFNWKEGLKEILKHPDIDVNIQDKFGNTALHYAAHLGYPDIAKQLLEREDLDVNIVNNEGFTAEDLAFRKTSAKEIAKSIKNHKSYKQSLREYEIKKLLSYIHEYRNSSSFKKALESVIDVNTEVDSYKKTLLHHACDAFEKRCVDVLLERPEINVNLQDSEGNTALHYACKQGSIGIVKRLLERDDIDYTIKNNYGKSAFEYVNYNDPSNIPLVTFLYNFRQNKTNIDEKNLSPENNVYSKEEIKQAFVAYLNTENYAKAIDLLEKTPLIDFSDKELMKKVGLTGNTELMDKVYEYKFSKQKTMLEEYEQRRKNFLENEIKTLSYAELKNNQVALNTLDGFKYLIENRDFNPNDNIKNETLFEKLCVIDSEGDLVKQILSKYDDVFIERIKNSTQSEKIKTLINEYESVGKYRIKLDKIKGLLVNTQTREVGIAQIKDFIESSDFNPTVSDSIGNSPLHIVSAIPDDSSRGMIQKLISKGIDINSKNIAQQNSLISVIKAFITTKDDVEKNSLLSNIKFLLDKGINIDEQDKLGQTAFHYVCFTTSVALLTLFLSKTPNVFIKDIKGNRASKYLKTDEMKKIYENYLKL